MAEGRFAEAYGGNRPLNYERFFVPAIGAPLATDLIRHASRRRRSFFGSMSRAPRSLAPWRRWVTNVAARWSAR